MSSSPRKQQFDRRKPGATLGHVGACVALAAALFVPSMSAGAADASDAAIDELVTIPVHQMLGRLNQPWVQLIDVRTAAEFDGSEIRALRGGHLPGAVNLVADGSDDGLHALDRRKETIVYGRSVEDASRFAARLKASGFYDVRVFEAGWQRWADDFALPVQAERIADVAAMQARIESLERELASRSLASAR